MSTVIIINPKLRVVSDAKGHRIEDEHGFVHASGFSDADDAQRYLDSSNAAIPASTEDAPAGE